MGKSVVIEHSDGTRTVYQSLDEDVEVIRGQTVLCGDLIGRTGITAVAALMVVGDGNGVVGVGLGKSVEIPDAVNKGIEDAKKNLVRISLKGTTIPHEIVA